MRHAIGACSIVNKGWEREVSERRNDVRVKGRERKRGEGKAQHSLVQYTIKQGGIGKGW